MPSLQYHDIIPKFSQNSCPLKTIHSKQLTSRYRIDLLKDFYKTELKNFYILRIKIEDQIKFFQK